jgi:hypothetical protein
MKRLVWLLIALFCTAVAQVQPVDLLPAKDRGCCCCEDQAGACGMPDCAPAPTACSQARIMLQTSAPLRIQARRAAAVAKKVSEPFYVQFVEKTAERPSFRVARLGTPAARVALFKAQCSFLI